MLGHWRRAFGAASDVFTWAIVRSIAYTLIIGVRLTRPHEEIKYTHAERNEIGFYAACNANWNYYCLPTFKVSDFTMRFCTSLVYVSMCMSDFSNNWSYYRGRISVDSWQRNGNCTSSRCKPSRSWRSVIKAIALATEIQELNIKKRANGEVQKRKHWTLKSVITFVPQFSIRSSYQ